jgi:regulator of RNase E activity RraA
MAEGSMQLWQTDEELFSLAEKELFTCVVGDVLDKQGLVHQYLSPEIRPLSPQRIVIGRAMPVLAGDAFQVTVQDSRNPLSGKPLGLMLEALDDLRPNEIYISTGSSPRNALWGELMSVRALKCGAPGSRVEWVRTRHQKNLGSGLSHLLFRIVWPGLRAPLQGP